MKCYRRASKFYIVLLVIVMMFQITGCSLSGASNVDRDEIEKEISEEYEEAIKEYREEVEELKSANEELSYEINAVSKEYEEKIKKLEDELSKDKTENEKQPTGVIVVPEYNGEASVVLNDGKPFFTEDDLKITGEDYSDLDAKGRCGVCIALVGPETLPAESRGSVGDIKPSGWDTVKYEGIDGNYLYNRCHLIGWQLTGENANVKNLITGTRYMNTQGMEPIETKVANYVESTGNHVLYRATPIFSGDNLLATGVLLEALSIEDKTISINAFCYNVQPDVTIDYATGKSEGPLFLGTEVDETPAEPEITRQQEETVNEEQAVTNEEPVESNQEVAEVTYVGNSNSRKFHSPWCSSVNDMKDRNKVFFYGDRQEVIDAGYEPCKRCNP